MLVSVIIPLYNSEKTIKRCVDSILNQTYAQIEIIIVDDGSGDTSPAICDDLAIAHDNIKVVHQDNGGPNAARNKGISMSQGEFIVFVDSDDEFYSNDTIERNIKFFENRPDVDIVSFPQYREKAIGNKNYCTKSGQFKNRTICNKLEIFSNWYNGRLIDGHFPGKIFRKSLFDGWSLVETIRFTEDHYDIPNICRRCKKVIISGIGGYVYKYNPNSLIHTNYTYEKRRGQLYSELSIYKYLCELNASGILKADIYNRALENAYYLSLAIPGDEAISLMRSVPMFYRGGNSLVKILKLFSVILGLRNGFRVTKNIAGLIDKLRNIRK